MEGRANDMQNSKRPGLQLGVITEFTLFTKVESGHEQALRAVFEGVRTDPSLREAVQQIGTLHEARFVLFDNDTRLLFCSSFDGDWDTYIDDFATTRIADLFDAVFSHVEGYPGCRNPNAKDWFMANALEASAYSCAYPSATVKTIWKALAVNRAFETVLDDPAAEQPLQAPALKPLLDQAAT